MGDGKLRMRVPGFEFQPERVTRSRVVLTQLLFVAVPVVPFHLPRTEPPETP